MMQIVRRYVYKMGFNPNPGTVLYSPTLALDRAWDEARMLYFETCSMNPGAQEGLRMIPTEETPTKLYDSMGFCVVCGWVLDEFIIDIKECPNGHGRTFPGEDSAGLPVITFEPIGD